ncbi:hypothetical protein ACHHYP_04012 [Achlya hypogyna]|uniref:RGS domain-containing protein n=1 Tax=Achlya hypogyna TaxID=1202772 RepID=A0A1V9Z2E6_ACHHY|nr:hypothetical protein ACHHYP_04012 [Achlya hypogyna]
MPVVSQPSSTAELSSSSWRPTPPDYLVGILLLFMLYMPVVVILFYARRDMPSIRYRNPVQMTICGIMASLYCFIKLAFQLTDTALDCGTYLDMCNVLFHATTFSVFLAEVSVAATFYLTELLVLFHTSGHNPTADRRARRLHVFLQPRTTWVVWGVGHVLWGLPSVVLLSAYAPTLADTTVATCPRDPHTAIQALGLVQLGLILAGGGLVTYFMSTLVDNFGLRSAYVHAHKVWVACFVGYSVLFALRDNSIVVTYKLEPALSAVGVQSVVFIYIARPLLLSFSDKQHHRMQWLTGTEKLLETFLLTPDGFASFAAFCRQECMYDVLIVWRATVKYEDDSNDDNDPQRIYRRYLRHDAPVPLRNLSSHLKDLYHGLFESNIKYHVDIADQDLERQWFQPLREELLKRLVAEVLPHFQVDPLGVGWPAFLHREQTSQALDLVLHQVDDKPEEVEKVLAPKRASIRHSVPKVVPTLSTIHSADDGESPRD